MADLVVCDFCCFIWTEKSQHARCMLVFYLADLPSSIVTPIIVRTHARYHRPRNRSSLRGISLSMLSCNPRDAIIPSQR